ncbi:MAG: hypothetical protein ACYTBX_02790 [Planctomycetota bacterium]|jgi:hypothetical protein
MMAHSYIRQAFKVFVISWVFFFIHSAAFATQNMLDFSDCIIVTPEKLAKVEQKVITILQEEIQKRTGIAIAVTNKWPKNDTSVIAVGTKDKLKKFAGPFSSEFKNLNIGDAEGFGLFAKSDPQKAVIIIGEDERGMLFGIGGLLRKAELRNGSIKVPADIKKVTAPKYPLRGHQLGYRPKTNAYDAWTVEQYDQYIRELALFGSNCIEIVPPVTDDKFKNEHMKYEPLNMMIKLTQIIDSYGLDVWIWYPNMGETEDFTEEKLMAKQIAERDEVFGKLKRVDHILVPGGDPGHLHPDQFFPWMDRVAQVLHKYHPNAKIWVSPQAMDPTREWLSKFYKYVNEKPDWMGGVVFAPWVKTPIEQMRQIVDKDIPIRRYPDITHNVACQYPVKDWDLALALTLHRECYNPRPVAMKKIHNKFAHLACGSLTYTEGIHDDINKFVWGDQDWDPQTEPIETLRDYCKLFIGPDYAEDMVQGFMALERNWEGPLAANNQVDVTVLQWRQLENDVPKSVKNNYRFQIGLMRAYYDAYIRRRLFNETELEMKTMDILRNAGEYGSLIAVKKAEKILARSTEEPVAPDFKKKCEYLADELFKNIGSQTYVEKHGAQHRTRGAFMDGINEPLNNRAWLSAQFKKIMKIEDEQGRLDEIEKVVNRNNPGPGGFYDDMGTLPSFKRISNTVAWEDDPGTLMSPRIAFYYNINRSSDAEFPLAWKNQACVIYETPLRFFWDNLDPAARYKIRVAYTGRRGKMIRLVANDVYNIHDLVSTLNPPIREFDIPVEATSGGKLELRWDCGEGQRGAQVSEIWLIKK